MKTWEDIVFPVKLCLYTRCIFSNIAVAGGLEYAYQLGREVEEL